VSQGYFNPKKSFRHQLVLLGCEGCEDGSCGPATSYLVFLFPFGFKEDLEAAIRISPGPLRLPYRTGAMLRS
jgi:hypothetical protein